MFLAKVRLFRALVAWVVRGVELKLGRRAYALAGAFWAVFVLVDISQLNWVGGIEDSTLDLALQYRIGARPVDPDILLVEIDDASISSIGGWPWSRSIYATAIEHLEVRGAKAVVLDILFPDPNEQSPGGDEHLSEVLSKSRSVYIPYVRNSAQDAESTVFAGNVPGVELLDQTASPLTPIGLTLPIFASAMKSGHLGMDNMFPDEDGIIRHLRLFDDVAGVRVPSIAYRLGKDLGYPSPEDLLAPNGDLRLNWRGKPRSYPSVPFARIYQEASEPAATQAADYSGKLVIISHTAIGMASLHPTPFGTLFPAGEILATGIDNVKNHDGIRSAPQQLSLSLTMLLVLGLSLIYSMNYTTKHLEEILLALNAIFLLAFVFCLNKLNLYLDLVSPIAYADLLYFAFSGYQLWKDAYLANRRYYETPLAEDQKYLASMMIFQFDTFSKAQRRHICRALGSYLLTLDSAPSIAYNWFEKTSLVGKQLEDLVIIYWLSEPGSDRLAIARHAQLIQKEVAQQLQRPFYLPEASTGGWRSSSVHDQEFKFSLDDPDALLHGLFARTLGGVTGQGRNFVMGEACSKQAA